MTKNTAFMTIAATTVALLLSAPALAEPGKADPPGYNGQGEGNHYGHGAPLPIAGAGLLALAGGAAFVAWRRKSNKA